MITESDLDARLRMMFRVRMRLGHFDPPGPLDAIPPSVICTDEAKALARHSVAQAVALVKNQNATLPLDAATAGAVALIGPNANLSHNTNYYAGPRSPCDMLFPTMREVITQ